MPDAHHLLSEIQDRLTRGEAPVQVIEALLPGSQAQAVAYARRLPLWDEYRGQFTPQVVAIARVLSRRGMRRYGLPLDSDGQVVERRPQRSANPPACPRRSFPLKVGDEELRVEYQPRYFPNSDQDLFTFTGPHGPPPRPPALSETGYWSHFTPRDAVDACGGPEPYAALLAETMLRGDRDFDAVFEGAWPEHVERRRKPVAAPPAAEPETPGTDRQAQDRPAAGTPSARVLAGEAGQAVAPPDEDKPSQRLLF